ncbi:hypothetical protein SAMN05216371_8188 [Streptomyces sp. TLI_053]|nr:hypothetical protein SAMN05216371_8188 [Streptomyces sp. TLI_053]
MIVRRPSLHRDAPLSERAAGFLAQVLTNEPDPTNANVSRARRLLDALATHGHQQALKLQRHLKDAPTPADTARAHRPDAPVARRERPRRAAGFPDGTGLRS